MRNAARKQFLEDIMDHLGFEGMIECLAEIAQDKAEFARANLVQVEERVLWEARRRECLATLHELRPIAAHLEVDAETA